MYSTLHQFLLQPISHFRYIFLKANLTAFIPLEQAEYATHTDPKVF